jgi:lipopolysaccharide/colanic/teichoic acid biosynthesis glycosyltransferase
VNSSRIENDAPPAALSASLNLLEDRTLLDSDAFRRVISLERKRSERSRKPFLLMLLGFAEDLRPETKVKLEHDFLRMISSATRETDVAGWYEGRSVLGIVFTELGDKDLSCETVSARISAAVHNNLPIKPYGRINISCHIFPEDWNRDGKQPPSDRRLYPDLAQRENSRKGLRAIKRLLDIGGSLTALVVLSPIFLLIAVAIKATSRGSVFFRQPRLGQYGATFSMLKFRSMYANSDSTAHQKYVRELIAGVADRNPSNGSKHGVFKLTKDGRITRVGAFLRRTSLDELPQFLNVLRGEMSLVGPRPPIDYELETYQIWHRRRLMEAKPGITGLWQVAGRNRIPFDEMVRLDLAYARSWSPWLDLKILLRTPGAVIEGAH